MINSTQLTIKFIYKGRVETRKIDRMHISYYEVKDFYRIPGKEFNYDIYKKDGVWFTMWDKALDNDLLQIVGAAIDEAEKTKRA